MNNRVMYDQNNRRFALSGSPVPPQNAPIITGLQSLPALSTFAPSHPGTPKRY